MSYLPQYPGQPIAQGQHTIHVKLVQELLNYHRIATQIDSDFGDQTGTNVAIFQQQHGLPTNRIVDQATFDALLAPMAAVLAPLNPAATDLRATLVRLAYQHLQQAPIEIGGQNRGPWVRLYTSGHDGTEYPWCAGFATFVLRQACDSLDLPMPVIRTLGCDELAISAKQHGRFIPNASVLPDPTAVLQPGDLYLRLDAPGDWGHTGIVIEVHHADFLAIEGNTNPVGSSDGYTVCELQRQYNHKDFVRIA